MNKIAELKENFCCKSKTISVWQDNPDLLDRFIVRIHSEATVYDAIMRSKNRNIPTNEKIFDTVKFLEENRFWRLNPFSLITCSESDPSIMKITSLLQKNSIKELWSPNLSNEQRNRKNPNPSNPTDLKNNCDYDNNSISLSKTHVDSFSDNKSEIKISAPQPDFIPPQTSTSLSSPPLIPSYSNTAVTTISSPSSASSSSSSSSAASSASLSSTSVNRVSISSQTTTTTVTNTVATTNFLSTPTSASIEIQTSPRKFAVVSAKSIGLKGMRRNNVLNEYNYDSCSNFSRTYAEAVRGSTQSSNLNKSLKSSSSSSVWE